MGSDQVVSQHPILEIKLHRVKIDAKPIGYWLFPGLVLNRHIYIYLSIRSIRILLVCQSIQSQLRSQQEVSRMRPARLGAGL